MKLNRLVTSTTWIFFVSAIAYAGQLSATHRSFSSAGSQAKEAESIVWPSFDSDWQTVKQGREGPFMTIRRIPKGQTMANWTDMLTVQLLDDHHANPMSAVALESRARYERKGGICMVKPQVLEATSTRLNSLQVATDVVFCPRSLTGYGELWVGRFIDAKQGYYMVHRFWRFPAYQPIPIQKSEIHQVKALMDEIKICDITAAGSNCGLPISAGRGQIIPRPSTPSRSKLVTVNMAGDLVVFLHNPIDPPKNAAVLTNEAEIKELARTPIDQTMTRYGSNRIVVTPQGTYATIDTRKDMKVIQGLLAAENSPAKSQLINEVKANAGGYAPPVLFALAKALLQSGRRDEAIFWFNAGRLRARFDANRSTDPSVGDSVEMMSRVMPVDFRRGQYNNVASMTEIIKRVLQWDASTPHHYDHRWINLHGMQAMNSTLNPENGAPKVQSLPQDQWGAIAKKTRDDYWQGYEKLLTALRKQEHRLEQ